MKFTLPELKKIVKRGTNTKIVEWLDTYSRIFYEKGYRDGEKAGIRLVSENILKLSLDKNKGDLMKLVREGLEYLDETTNVGANNGRKRMEPESSESSGGQGINSGDADSGPAGTDSKG